MTEAPEIIYVVVPFNLVFTSKEAAETWIGTHFGSGEVVCYKRVKGEA